MKKIYLLIVLASFLNHKIAAQKIDGQWKGYFNSTGDIVLSGSDNTEYVLELEFNGDKVSGLSYSYFQGRRYYVICKLQGIYYKSSKSMKVVEVERIKGNTPPDFSDCFQTHYLAYKKEGKQEQLVGRWEEAPGQRGGCGLGKTTLIRRTLSNDLASFKKPVPSKNEPTTNNNKLVKKLPDFSDKNKTTKSLIPKIKIDPKKTTTIVATKTTKPTTNQPDKKVATLVIPKNSTPKKTVPATVTKLAATNTTPVNIKVDSVKSTVKATPKLKEKAIIDNANFEKRSSEIVKTIQIEHATFTVTLYDNGEVDGDSVSVFYNGKLIIEKKRLSEKPITLTLEANSGYEINELTMYAENLGEIPPNTALMIVNDGEKRYEVRISSDLKKSGTIQFVHKSSTQ